MVSKLPIIWKQTVSGGRALLDESVEAALLGGMPTSSPPLRVPSERSLIRDGTATATTHDAAATRATGDGGSGRPDAGLVGGKTKAEIARRIAQGHPSATELVRFWTALAVCHQAEVSRYRTFRV